MKRWIWPYVTLIGLLLVAGVVAAAQNIPRLTIHELKQQMETGTILVVDVRAPRDWNPSDIKIRDAKRLAPGEKWILEEKRSQPIALYCA